ncbi:hypothetical protein [Streptomyces diastatochromogenes]|uniref:Uncharacterized protein n=1 Tax=Streptomyces diastatochromogenes TaxID=42236 RepID=A0A233SNI5_STRDA|nr:hypothetical protein [Streptomyces diastatochromogenes]MCZ0986899.1 hypothetical protein [Streptomyces diastatochromogenes]OXY97211.1 hypothetical protein BEK98_09790 [Streptomyces diastatochromogenes]
MASKKVVTVAVLVTVLTWSTVMTVLGQVAAMATLLPSLGLLVQQIVQALSGSDGSRTPDGPTATGTGGEEPPR